MTTHESAPSRGAGKEDRLPAPSIRHNSKPAQLCRSAVVTLFAALLSAIGAHGAAPPMKPGIAASSVSQSSAPAELAGLRPAVLTLASRAADRYLAHHAVAKPDLLTIIDYSLPSTARRIWVIDRTSHAVLFHRLVAHGKGSGENLATRFSNREGSLESSLGLFLTQETYIGRNGYSLRLKGLEAGINDQARERTIVMHGAWYVTPEFARQYGRLGRSWGCPALNPDVARAVIDEIHGGSLLFIYGPDRSWFHRSRYLLAQVGTAAAQALGITAGP